MGFGTTWRGVGAGAAACGCAALAVALALAAGAASGGGSGGAEAPGGGERVAWTTSRVKGSPEPPPPYTTERAFPGLRFDQCVDLAAMPGADRLFVVEWRGRIWSFPNREDAERADLAADFAAGIPGTRETYSIAFHPRFEENRFVYICYIMDPGLEDGSRISRFRVTREEPPRIDLSSETRIFSWLSGGHNGCCLRFGPDGCLYISTGDGTGPNPPDALRAGQDVSNVLSAILRIDVDDPEPGRNYRIPADNPFVDLPGARGEIWAYGLRNPWRMSFDRATGDLWVGDVGWERWEMLNRIERGGNYGWAVTEGRYPTNPEWERGPTPILPPTIDHPHSESSSITDGLTYHGERLPELRGHHIYGDYDTGKIWGFRFADGKVTEHRELADTTHRIVAFGEDGEGDFLILDHTAGTLHRLVRNESSGGSGDFPRRLSETGIFEGLGVVDGDSGAGSVRPSAGVSPYAIVAEPWEDHATAERWVAIPGREAIRTDMGPGAEGAERSGVVEGLGFPKDSVLAKTLSLDLAPGTPGGGRRRVETQLLHFDGLEWRAYSYAWNAEGTDAELVDAGGAERTFEVADPGAPGGVRRQVWRFAGRAECLRCHNKWSGPPLGFNAAQLDRADAGGSPQLAALAGAGLFEPSAPEPPAAGRRLASPRDDSAPLDLRARSYLHVNCSQCHRTHAGSGVLSKMTIDTPLEKADMVGARPSQGTFGLHDARVIAPGDPHRSILAYRMSKTGSGRMPYLGSTEVDARGLELLSAWIAGLPAAVGEDGAEDDPAARRRASEDADAAALLAGAEGESRDGAIDRLLGSPRGAFLLARTLDRADLPRSTFEAALARAEGRFESEPGTRDLFERFLPADRRTERLGASADPSRILALRGDADRGRRLFFEAEGVSCRSCHRIGGAGVEVGPDLDGVGGRLDRAVLLESLLEPSKVIDPKYVNYLVETRDGSVLGGLLVERGPGGVTLRDSRGELIRIAADDAEVVAPQAQSLMPEGLLRDLTPGQAADLLEYLESLK